MGEVIFFLFFVVLLQFIEQGLNNLCCYRKSVRHIVMPCKFCVFVHNLLLIVIVYTVSVNVADQPHFPMYFPSKQFDFNCLL